MMNTREQIARPKHLALVGALLMTACGGSTPSTYNPNDPLNQCTPERIYISVVPSGVLLGGGETTATYRVTGDCDQMPTTAQASGLDGIGVHVTPQGQDLLVNFSVPADVTPGKRSLTIQIQRGPAKTSLTLPIWVLNPTTFTMDAFANVAAGADTSFHGERANSPDEGQLLSVRLIGAPPGITVSNANLRIRDDGTIIGADPLFASADVPPGTYAASLAIQPGASGVELTLPFTINVYGTSIYNTHALASDLAADPQGQIWFVNNRNELKQLNPSNGKIKTYSVGGADSVLSKVLSDLQGNLWLMDLSPTKPGLFYLEQASRTPRKVDGAITNVIAAADGTAWAVESGSLLTHVLPDGTKKTFEAPVSGRLNDLTLANDGTVWMTIFNQPYLIQFDPKIQMFNSYTPSIPNTTVIPDSLQVDDNGFVWFTRFAYDFEWSFYRYNPKTQRLQFAGEIMPELGAGFSEPYFAKDAQGNFWSKVRFTDGGHLWTKIDFKNKRLARYGNASDGINFVSPERVSFDRQGNLWWATGDYNVSGKQIIGKLIP